MDRMLQRNPSAIAQGDPPVIRQISATDVAARLGTDHEPFLLDVHVDAEVKPPSTGTWQLPPTPYREPAFGKRWLPEETPAK